MVTHRFGSYEWCEGPVSGIDLIRVREGEPRKQVSSYTETVKVVVMTCDDATWTTSGVGGLMGRDRTHK